MMLNGFWTQDEALRRIPLTRKSTCRRRVSFKRTDVFENNLVTTNGELSGIAA